MAAEEAGQVPKNRTESSIDSRRRKYPIHSETMMSTFSGSSRSSAFVWITFKRSRAGADERHGILQTKDVWRRTQERQRPGGRARRRQAGGWGQSNWIVPSAETRRESRGRGGCYRCRRLPSQRRQAGSPPRYGPRHSPSQVSLRGQPCMWPAEAVRGRASSEPSSKVTTGSANSGGFQRQCTATRWL